MRSREKGAVIMLKFTPIGLLLMVMYLLITWLVNRKRDISKVKQVINFLFFMYILAVVAVTFFPLPIDQRYIVDKIKTGLHQSNNFVPFKTISEVLYNHYYMIALKNIGGNILLFVPLGFFIPLIWGKVNWNRAVLLGFASSISIELTQAIISLLLGFTYRSSDVDDIILNTVGFTFGYVCFNVLIKIVSTIVEKGSKGQIKNGIH
jgi:glycopeptide antibiotics resistance protein